MRICSRKVRVFIVTLILMCIAKAQATDGDICRKGVFQIVEIISDVFNIEADYELCSATGKIDQITDN